MQHSNIFARSDTMLGICEATGEDLGFNPLFLRIAFALPLIWNPVAVIGAYLALGFVVLLSRLLFPKPRPAVTVQPLAAAEVEPAAAEMPRQPVVEMQEQEFAAAA